MSVYTNQTNANTTTSFFGAGGGGSNFPNGISVGNPPFVLQNGGEGVNALQVLNVNTGDNGFIQLSGAQIGNNGQNFAQITSSTISVCDSNTNAPTPFMSVVKRNLGNPCYGLSNISSIGGVMTTTDSPPNYNPMFFTIRPDQAVKGGSVYATFNWDAVDTGANVACRVGADSQSAYIAAEWLGYITMPMRVSGATITMNSDNETFLYMDGKEGAIGTISTGTAFISGSNTFSSITSADKQNTANMDALLSTLKATYPDCFLP